MNVSEVVDDDYTEIEREGRAIRVGQNPRAIRVSPDGNTVYVYNALDFNVGVYKAANMEKMATIKVCDPPKTPEWVRGKVLFSTALPPMSSQRWIACSSCHPRWAQRWQGLAEPRRVAQNAGFLWPGPHAAFALVGGSR